MAWLALLTRIGMLEVLGFTVLDKVRHHHRCRVEGRPNQAAPVFPRTGHRQARYSPKG